MPVLRVEKITRAMLREWPNRLFVFGDNMQHSGLGGQAAEMRGEPNAVGIPTKWKPARGPDAYFDDRARNAFWASALPVFRRLKTHLEKGGTVVWPAAGIGTGLADLERRAPRIFRDINLALAKLEAI